jgi:hypothetical protein
MRRHLGYIVERYGDYGWTNAMVMIDVDDDGEYETEVILKDEEYAKKCMLELQSESDREHFDFRIVTTVQLH